jgi:hypothetical protein
MLRPHVCPDLQSFEGPALPAVEVTVRMCGVLDVTEKHLLRVPATAAQRLADQVASITHAVSTVYIGSASRATAWPCRR